jgi:hypothetical protein
MPSHYFTLLFSLFRSCMRFRFQIYFINFFFFLFLRWAVPRPHIPFPPDLILYVNLVAMGPVHLSPVTWPQALQYWYSLTPLMHIVAQLRPIDLHNFLGQIPENMIKMKKMIICISLNANFLANFNTAEKASKKFIQKCYRPKTFAESIESLR